MFSKASDKLTDALFQLKMSSKQMSRLSSKMEQEAEREKSKLKKALVEQHYDIAKVYAENAVRKHNESVNYLRMSSRFDAIGSRVQSALQMKEAVKNIGMVSKDLEKAMKSMDLQKIEQVMSKFESQFEDMDVRSITMENAMGNAVTLSAPEDQVNNLLKKVADEQQLDISAWLANAPSSVGASESSKVDDEGLSRRLAAIRQS
ncbi:Charged multivesicular body protein 1 [Fasciola hepatica]|uniref:Charged multivesicular body protein 1 n=1 Tax=Fasciola hepatica TaxID=6192 RepID=A0A4E0RBD7_FASHE|nr:Charged multivesicular body protein 1 [Fasciola hepatica]